MTINLNAAYIEIVPFQRTTSEKESITESVLEPAASNSNNTPCIGIVDELKSVQSDSVTVIPSTSSSQSMSKPLDKALDSDSEVIPIKRQKSIKTSFQEISSYSESGMKTRKLNNCLLYMISKDHQPFSIVENEGFKNLMKAVAPQYKIPSRTSLRRWLDNKYDVVSETFKKKLSSIEDLTLTTDIWSDTLNMKSFIGVTVHFGIKVELISVTLGVYELDERHTSQYISEMLLKTCVEWGIKKDNVTAVVTDNAANMVKAVELTFAGVAGEPVAREVQKLALQEITKRMGSIEHVTPLAIANILDPRFKIIHFNDAIACSNAVSKIKDLMKIHLRQIEEIESDSDKSDKSEETFSLWSDHYKLVHRNWKSNKSEDSLSDELSVYLTSPVGRLNDNPLEIWKDYKIQFPILHKIAFKYLTMVGTSVPSERLFSQAAQVMTQQRNRLKGKRLGKILFLQSIDKNYWDIY
ncbi:unnamed protein product [Parnassius mnemosyne]|uniref:HAT C-terminal dimerisation domain-containing protein n=1 Tax=Parnassius mnemosyne TaxID=213953 RepID=A0AAV1LV28_9NEOP